MPEPFEVPASGADVFRNFVLPVPAVGRRWVRAWEFRPGNATAVHHATIGLDATRTSRALDARDAAPGYEGIVPFSVTNPDGYFLGWSPGQRQPQQALPHMPWPLPAAADVMFSIHLRPTGRAQSVQASIGLYFTDEAADRAPVTLRLGRQDIDIPAGESRYTIRNEYRLPVDVELHSVYPHAHHLAREMSGFAVLPDGTRRDLLVITDWDFNWQDVYRYRTPVFLPSGTTVHMEYTYDNSGHRQHGGGMPRRVTYGPNSSDEMGDLWLQLVPRHSDERSMLVRDFERKLLPETITGLEMMIALDPGNAALHDDAGLLRQEAGEFEQAVTHFRESLRLRPSAVASNNLGSALLNLKHLDEARTHLQQAIATDPDYAMPHYNLGVVLQLQGRTAQAIDEYRTAVRLNADHPESHFLLGSALAAVGDAGGARQHYRVAIDLRPSWPVALIELSWLLATDAHSTPQDRRESVALAERAARATTPSTVSALDALAVACAASGDFDRALSIEIEARRRAASEGQAELARQIGERVSLFERHIPFTITR